MSDDKFDNLPNSLGLSDWNEIPFAAFQSDPAMRLVGGTAITGIGGFADFDLLERRAVITISEDIIQERGFTSSASLSDLGGGDFALSEVWRPKGFHGRITDGVVYVQSFDQDMAARYKLPGHLDKANFCLPLLAVGVLESRTKKLSGFVGSALYYPRIITLHGTRGVGYPIKRRVGKPLDAEQVEELIAATNEEAIEIGRHLAAIAMRHPFSGGGMSGGKRSKV